MNMETDPAKIKKKKGKCRNFEGGECVKAEVGEIQEISSNELFVCQDCKQPLTEIASSNSKKALPFIIPLIVLLLKSVTPLNKLLFPSQGK